MRVEFKTEGGIAHFPGLSRPVAIDVDALPADEAAELRRRLDEAGVMEQPAPAAARAAPRTGGADRRRYTITVEADGRQHSVSVTDPVEDPALRALVDHLEGRARAARAAARAAAGAKQSEG